MKIVIAGATRGLGRALVQWYATHGHTVAGCGRTLAKVESLSTAHPAPHLFSRVDVRQAAQVDEWAAVVLRAFGPPDLLITCAAAMNQAAPLWKVPAQEFDGIVATNVAGVANLVRAFVPAMVAANHGVIVNFSSGWGQTVAPNVAPYCATKWAIEGMTKALAEEIPAGMTAIPLSPGVIDTELLRIAWPSGASGNPKPAEWAESAAPFILALGRKENGVSVRIPKIPFSPLP